VPRSPAPPRPLANGTIALLGAMVAFGPLTVDLYLPALPALGDDLGAGESTVQVTLSATLLGLAFGQLLMGPVSDRAGRKPPVIVGGALHVVASLACVMTSSVVVLTTARFVQGVGASAAAVVALAVVRDVATGNAGSRLMSRLILILGVVPIVAPFLGGLLLSLTSWRGVFVALGVAGLVLTASVTYGLPETRPHHLGSHPTVALPQARRPLRLLGDRALMGWSLASGFATAATFAWVAGSPFVLREQFALNGRSFGLVFGTSAIWLVIGAQASARLVVRWPPERVLGGGLGTALIAAFVLFIAAASSWGGVMGVLAPIWVILAGVGAAMPNAPTLALADHGHDAGAASAVIGALRYGVAATAGPLVGATGGGATAMAGIVLASLVMALAAAVWSATTPSHRFRAAEGCEQRTPSPHP
jgi:MFS transporter, DHA1 family, multidrug resistance protein